MPTYSLRIYETPDNPPRTVNLRASITETGARLLAELHLPDVSVNGGRIAVHREGEPFPVGTLHRTQAGTSGGTNHQAASQGDTMKVRDEIFGSEYEVGAVRWVEERAIPRDSTTSRGIINLWGHDTRTSPTQRAWALNADGDEWFPVDVL